MCEHTNQDSILGIFRKISASVGAFIFGTVLYPIGPFV